MRLRGFPGWLPRVMLVLLCGTICGLLAGARLAPVERLERLVFDRSLSFVPSQDPPERLALVLGGERSMSTLRSWPWPRRVHAALLERLRLARVVVLDILFPETATESDDRLLVDAVRTYGNVASGVHLAVREGKTRLIPPFRELFDVVAAVGVTNVAADTDGLFRKASLLWPLPEGALPSLPLAAAMLARHATPEITERDEGYELVLPWGNIPLADDFSMWIRFPRKPIETYEYIDVLEGRISPETFRGAIVFVGMGASGAEDFYTIPDGSVVPGAAYEAAALRTILDGRAPERLPPLADGISSALLAAYGTGAALLLPPRLSPVAALLAALAWSAGTHVLLHDKLIWASIVAPIIACVLSFGTALFARLRRISHEWTVRSLPVESLLSLAHGDTLRDSYEAHLRFLWESARRDTGMQLLHPKARMRDLLEELRMARGVPELRGEGILLVDAPKHPRHRMLVPLPFAEGDEPCYTVLGWQNSVSVEQMKSVAVLVLSTAFYFHAVDESNARREMLYDTLRAMITALDAKDADTAGHSERVAELSTNLAKWLGLDERAAEDISFGGILHDIGKIGIPDSVLNKPGKLTDEEYAAIRSHPVIGELILMSVKLPELAMRGMAEHHEQVDGKGYPRRLAGSDISISGKIIAVADVFDALASDRPYRKSWPLVEVCDHMHRLKGTAFDPQVVETLLEHVAPEEWTPPENP